VADKKYTIFWRKKKKGVLDHIYKRKKGVKLVRARQGGWKRTRWLGGRTQRGVNQRKNLRAVAESLMTLLRLELRDH